MNNYYNYPYYHNAKNEPCTYVSSEDMHDQDSNQLASDINEGLIRGNMFTNLYDPYIQSEPFTLNPVSERDAMLNKVRANTFAVIDLNLYLDTHPQDSEKIELYNQIMEQLKSSKSDYEQKYGPLTLSSEMLNNKPWMWLNPPWPWEVK